MKHIELSNGKAYRYHFKNSGEATYTNLQWLNRASFNLLALVLPVGVPLILLNLVAYFKLGGLFNPIFMYSVPFSLYYAYNVIDTEIRFSNAKKLYNEEVKKGNIQIEELD